MNGDIFMEKLYAAFLIGLFFSPPISRALAADTDLKPIFETRYALMKSAMGSRDGKAIATLLAPDFLSIDASGQRENSDQMIQEVNTLPIDPQKVSKTTINSVKVTGDTAIVDQSYDMKTRKTGADGKTADVELIAVSEDTWINLKGVWLIQKTVTNQIDYTVNGKSVMHKIRNEK